MCMREQLWEQTTLRERVSVRAGEENEKEKLISCEQEWMNERTSEQIEP